MTPLDPLRRLFAYDHWANAEVLAALRAGGTARSQKLLAHILVAEALWFDRLHQRPASLAVWPELSLDECESWLARLQASWSAYLDGLDQAALAQSVSYVNSKGEPWSSTVHDILLHVVLHSSYHRGQIATDTRTAGLTPAYTDFIHAARQGRLP